MPGAPRRRAPPAADSVAPGAARTPAPAGSSLPPRLSMSGARAAYLGPGLDLAPHRNAVATVAIALEGPFGLSLPADGRAPQPRTSALIPPNSLHHLTASGPMVFVYLDALGDDHRQLCALDLDRGRAHLADIGAAELARWDVDAICAALGVPARPEPDPRIAAAIRCLDARPQDFPRIADLAALAGLSASRFQALLADAVGMPFRRYRTWRRMAVVMQALARGGTLTDAAQAAGFSGSSHLSATFRAMFGLSPSSVVRLGLTRGLAPGASRSPGTSRAARGG